ncbi:uncharacterized protein LOC134283579 [Saccostrea cucullata]|uniref:uncharacterized protein LOC134283579 n=1 Tax=Saccostrea cuccullata TaxID=36930 RepID=UPI002ED52DD5
MSEENQKGLNRSAVNMDENSYRSYSHDQMSGDYREDRMRSTRRGCEDTPNGYHGNQTSREDNKEMNRFTSRSYEGMQNSYRRDQPSRKDIQYRNRSTRPRYEDKQISCRREPLRRDHLERKLRSNRKRKEDIPNSYHSNKASRKDNQDRDRSATRRNDSRRGKDYLEKFEGHGMPRTEEWIVTPDKNSREENDDLAVKIYKVLLDEGGKLKKKRFEACLRAEPLTMRFMPKGSFIKFLEDYSNIFDISDGSKDEQEEGEITDQEIKARSEIQICLKHSSASQICSGNCNNLHICKFKFISDCPFENCWYGHDLKTDHNRHSLMHHFMQFLEPDQVRMLISDLEHRKGVTIPSICTYYNKINGCKEPVKCPHLHVCAYIADKCRFQPNCKRSHNLEDEQPKKVLSKFGIEIDAHNKDSLLKMLKVGSLHSPGGQGVRKITHLNTRSGSIVPDETAQEEAKDNQEGNVLEPRSEISKPLRYWNMDCE